MNLKEAFRYQNRLQSDIDEAKLILSGEKNVTKVEKTHLRHKVNPEASDRSGLRPHVSMSFTILSSGGQPGFRPS